MTSITDWPQQMKEIREPGVRSIKINPNWSTGSKDTGKNIA